MTVYTVTMYPSLQMYYFAKGKYCKQIAKQNRIVYNEIEVNICLRRMVKRFFSIRRVFF